MSIYLYIFSASVILTIFPLWRKNATFVPFVLWILLTWFVGYRYWIGVDWPTYNVIFRDVSNLPFLDALRSGDLGYSVVNWVVGRSGGQIWHVNLVCAAIFSYGLLKYCNDLEYPGLAFLVAIPTLIIVTSMGYTRQAVAIGCIMVAYRHFQGKISWRWLVWLVAALLFHKSAIFALPVFIFAGSKNRVVIVVTGLIIAGIFVDFVVARSFSNLINIYVEGDLESSGTLPRVAIGALAAVGFFFMKDKRSLLDKRYELLRNASLVMIILPLTLPFMPSTIIDRIGVIFLPFQSAIASSLVYSYSDKRIVAGALISLIIGLSAAVLVIWLLYATFATYWIPYQNVLFVRWPSA